MNRIMRADNDRISAELNRQENEEESPDTVDEVYMQKPRQMDLNKDPGIFTQKKWDAIDTKESIFDSTAVFKTR